MPSSEIPPPKKHKRNRSADLMELNELDSSFLAAMHADLEKMQTTLQEDHMLVKALDPAVENISSVLQSLKYIEEYKKRPGNQDVTFAALSFSNVEEKHLINLGIHQMIPLSASKATSKIDDFFDTSDEYKAIITFWKGDGRLHEGKGALLATSLKHIAQTTSLVTEVGRRIIVDRIIQEVITFLMSLGMYAYLFPEFKLSVATANPVGIRYATDANTDRQRRYTTFLTGSVDYFALGFDATTMNSDKRSAEKELLSQSTLSSLIGQHGPLEQIFPQATLFLNHLRLLHIEAKRQKGKQELKLHKPQAISETLATMALTEKGQGVWCLTTGHEWIFGLVAGNTTTEDQKTSYTLGSMKIDFDSPTLHDQLRNIFFIMVYWFVEDPAMIENMLMSFA